MTIDEFVIVPKEATPEMLNQIEGCYCEGRCGEPSELYLYDVWPDALAAAPAHNLIAVDKGELEALIAAVTKSAETFRWYEKLHAAKPDLEKAQRNAEFAEICEKSLAPFKGDKA